MRDDLCTIARYGTERGLPMVMGTSGYLIDQAAAKNSATPGYGLWP